MKKLIFKLPNKRTVMTGDSIMFKKQTIKQILLLLLLLIPILIFYWFTYHYTENMMWLDDYNHIIAPFYDYLQAHHFSQIIAAIFKQANEYRQPFLGVISIIQYSLTGTLNFAYYPIWGNLSVFMIFVLFVKVLRDVGIKDLKYYLPLSFILFNLHVFIIITWAITSCQYLCALCYGLWTIYFLTRQSAKSFKWALLMLLLSIYSFGSGQFLIPIGILYFILIKQYRKLVYWLLFSGMVLIIYYYHYDSNGLNGKILSNIFQKTNEVIEGFLYLWGAYTDVTFSNHPLWQNWIPLGTGFFTFGICFYVFIDLASKCFQVKKIITEKLPEERFLLLCLVFIFIITAAIATARLGENIREGMTVSNHRYYAGLGLLVVYMWSILEKKSATIINGLIFASSLFFLTSIFKNIVEVSKKEKLWITHTFNTYQNGLPYQDVSYQYQMKYDSLLAQKKVDIYPILKVHQDWLKYVGNEFETLPNSPINIKSVERATDGNYIISADMSLLESDKENGAYFTITSKQHFYIFPAVQNNFDGINPFIRLNQYKSVIDTRNIFKGEYKIGLCLIKNGESEFYRTYEKINIL